jgi:hypothetical protein
MIDHKPAALMPTWEQAISARYPQYTELIKQHVETHQKRCQLRARRHRRWFRLTGVLTILFSVSLPALTSANFNGRDTLIAALAVGVAGLSGLRAFYQWDQSWKLYRSQEIALLSLLTKWQLGMVSIVKASAPDTANAGNDGPRQPAQDPDAGRPGNPDDLAHDLTESVLNEAYEMGRAELTDFFSGLAWPQRGN